MNGVFLRAEDTHLVTPGIQYHRGGVVESTTVDVVDETIQQATLTADYQANGGILSFFLSNNGGEDWVKSIPGVAVSFSSNGSDLRWKVELTADPIWPRSPVVSNLRIEYSSQRSLADDYEVDDSCAQARPIAVNGAAQQHNFHQVDDVDWLWLDVIQGRTYVIQTSQSEANADTVFAYYQDCTQAPLGTSDNIYGQDNLFTFIANYTGRLYVRVTNNDPLLAGEFTGYLLSARLTSSAPVVVIVSGHIDNFSLQSNIDYSADLAYRTFVNAGVPKDNIRYFAPSSNRDVDYNGSMDDIAGPAVPALVRDAITGLVTDPRGKVGSSLLPLPG